MSQSGESDRRTEKLAKYLARCGVAARRKCETMIRGGWVSVDGMRTTEPATRIDPLHQKIRLRGTLVKPPAELRYIILNKPPGVLCTRRQSREKGRTVFDIVTVKERLFNVGRLDKETSGLLILTNDGDLAQRLMHPSFEKEKEYIITTGRPLNKTDLKSLLQGVILEDGLSKFRSVEMLSDDQIRVVLTQGRKRQIRRTCKAIGLPVRHLHRTRVGNLTLSDLAEGQWRDLTSTEVKTIKSSVQ